MILKKLYKYQDNVMYGLYLSYFLYSKKNLVNIKKVNIIKNFKKLEIIPIIQDNIEELLIVFVI